jgi:cytochrome P450
MFMRYADVSAALRHPQLRVSKVLEPAVRMPKVLQPVVRPSVRLFSRMMVLSDPPDHTRLRSLASRAFTPRSVEGMQPRIEAIADELLSAFDPSGPVDLMESYANQLPVMVIAEMLGAKVKNRRQFKRWSDDFLLLISGSGRPPAQIALRSSVSMYFLQRFLRRLIRERRANPSGNILDNLIAAEEGGDVLTEQELVSNTTLLLIAGHVTTTNLIGSGLLSLLQNPEQMELLRERPELMPFAVEEFLRFESPLQFTARVAGEDLEVNGHPVESGRMVVLGLGIANRDPEQFPHPDELDITREPNRHLAFAGGAHFCLGAALARMEGQIAIQAVLRRFPGMRLSEGPVVWGKTGTLRGLERLTVWLRDGPVAAIP